MLKKVLIFGGLGAAALGAFGIYKYYQKQINLFYGFTYKVKSINPVSRKDNFLKLRVMIEIDNPSALQFTLSSYNFDVMLNRNNKIGVVSNSDVNQVLRRNGRSYITFDFDVSLKDLNWVSTGLDLLLGGKNSLITLQGDLKVRTGIIFLRVPVDLSYTFKYLAS